MDAEEVLQGLLLLSLPAHQEPTWLEKLLHSKVFSFIPFNVNPVLNHFVFKVRILWSSEMGHQGEFADNLGSGPY